MFKKLLDVVAGVICGVWRLLDVARRLWGVWRLLDGAFVGFKGVCRLLDGIVRGFWGVCRLLDPTGGICEIWRLLDGVCGGLTGVCRLLDGIVGGFWGVCRLLDATGGFWEVWTPLQGVAIISGVWRLQDGIFGCNWDAWTPLDEVCGDFSVVNSVVVSIWGDCWLLHGVGCIWEICRLLSDVTEGFGGVWRQLPVWGMMFVDPLISNVLVELSLLVIVFSSSCRKISFYCFWLF